MNLDERNAVLDKKIEETDLAKAVETLVKDAKKRKAQLRLLTISIILDLLLTIGLAIVSAQTRIIASQSDSNKEAVLRTCEAGNIYRTNNKQLWTYILAIPSPQPVTPERQKAIDGFKSFVDKTFELRDCNSVTGK